MPSRRRNRLILAGLALLLAAGLAFWWRSGVGDRADPDDPAQVALGRAVYAQHCASCHGARLEGQPNWRERLPNGRMKAPPHDVSGHTWHHPDEMLFGITKHGIERYAPAGYKSDMPAFAEVLSDAEIWAVLAYIKSNWPKAVQERQAGMSARR